MKILVKAFGVIIILSATSFGAYKIYEGPLFRIKKFHITLDKNSNDKYIFSKIKSNIQKNINSLKGSSLIILDLSKIKKVILADSRVESFNLLRRFPNQLYVEISPKKPEALIMSRNELKLISSQGELYSFEKDKNYDLPILQGKLLKQSKERRGKVLSFLKEISSNDLFNSKNISEVSFNKKSGLRIVLNSGLEVTLGKEDILSKSMRIEKVLQYLKSNEITCRAIDASYSKKVVVRLRNEP